MGWIRALNAVTAVFLKQPCPLCDRPSARVVCPGCWQRLQSAAGQQPPAPVGAALSVLAWGKYEAVLKQAIAALKYHNHPQLAVPLGAALAQHWQQMPIPTGQPPWIVPIPMHAEKQRQRGFNQSELLAQAFCQQTGLPLLRRGLIRQRATAPQFGLGIQARQHNLADAFVLGPDLRQRHRQQRPILLLDDIYTTGATVKAAATVLRRSGFSVCGVAAIARAQLR